MFPAGSVNQAMNGPAAAEDAALVLVEAVVAGELDAAPGQLVDGGVDVVDREVEDRVRAGTWSGLG